MLAPAPIILIHKITPVKRLLSDAEKAFVALMSQIIVNKTFNDSNKNMRSISAL